MTDLLKYHAKICYTAIGVLIHDDKVLLVKHKKAGIWLCPGGHVEKNELPHQTAEREFWEETGLSVKAVDYGLQTADKENDRESLPNPFHSNVHWVSKTNYELRMKNPKTYTPKAPWSKGCEMHFGLSYLVRLIGSDKFKENVEETDGIAWFNQAEALEVLNQQMIKDEINFAFAYSKQS